MEELSTTRPLPVRNIQIGRPNRSLSRVPFWPWNWLRARSPPRRYPLPPTESWTVSNYYKQSVYDPKESKIGDIGDVLVDKAGKVTGLVVGVGGFLGAGEKDVIVPFTAIKPPRRMTSGG